MGIKTIGISWFWIGMSIAAPTLAGFAIALPFWISRNATMGNVVGAGVILFGTLLAVLREYVDLRTVRADCVARNIPCRILPDDFTRFYIYTSIGFAEVFAFFLISLAIEERLRARERAPEWR